MIDFTHDGPFSNKVDELFPSRVRIIGLGLTGTSVCDQLVLHGGSKHDLWAVDSDQQTIDASIVTQRHIVGRYLTRGLGCGGDFDLAREVVALETERLESLTDGCDFLVLIVGLAGATGVALAEFLAHHARQAEAKVMILGVQPFAFEGMQRRQQAIRATALLRQEADSVLVLAQDRLAETPAVCKNIRYGFHIMHQHLAKATEAISQIVCKRGLIQLSFSDIRSLYGRYSGTEVLENCWVSHTEGDLQDDAESLIQGLLSGPIVQDESIWRHVDHALVTVRGTREWGLADVQETIVLLRERLPKHVAISTSANLEEPFSRKVSLTLLLAKTAPAPHVETNEIPLPNYAKTKPTTKTQELPSMALPAKPANPIKLKQPQRELEPAWQEDEKLEEIQSETNPSDVPWKASLDEENEADHEWNQPVVEKNIEPDTSWEEEEWAEDLEPMNEEASIQDQPHSVEEPVVVSTEPFPFTEPEQPRVMQPKHHPTKQEEIQFEPVTRGRFEKSFETFYRGENLDHPTFRRRRLSIRL